jgi:hypothetical protein
MTPELWLELQRLLSGLCDGELTDVQQARLEEVLRDDAECRRLYLQYIDMHARLLVHPRFSIAPVLSFDQRQESRPATTVGAPAPRSDYRARSGRGRRGLRVALHYVVVAAGTLAASLLAQVFWLGARAPQNGRPGPLQSLAAQGPGYVATLTQTANCVWESAGQPGRAGSRLLPGELRLQEGVAKLHFDSGSDLVIEGPALLRVDSSSAATVLRGKVVFQADETAASFTLRTPSSRLVHLGTEYAVVVDADHEEVHVFDGEVHRTATMANGSAEPERLMAGQARRYEPTVEGAGRAVLLDEERFQREVRGLLPDPAAGLLAYEGFDYRDAEVLRAGQANGGTGWITPWKGFARPLDEGNQNRLALNPSESLVRSGLAVRSVGGCFDYTGFAKYYRRLATPVRLDTDGVYYLSFLFRRQGPPADPLNALAVLLRTTDELDRELRKERADPQQRLNIGVGGANQLFTHLQGVGSRTPLPLSYGTTYLLVAKIVAGRSKPDQVFMRVYGPEEPIEREEPGSWSVLGQPLESDLVFDWLEVHINSKTRQTIDEVRLGTTWASVTAPWTDVATAKSEGKP